MTTEKKMNTMMKKGLLLLLAGACIGLAQASIFDKPVYNTGKPLTDRPMAFVDFKELADAHPADNLVFSDFSGKKFKISDARGKLLILDMWATWCQPCVREIPLITALQKKLGKKVQFVSVSVDEDTEEVKDFLSEHHFKDFSTMLDPAKTILSVIPSDVVPTAFFFDGKGNLVAFVRGYVDWEGDGVADFINRLADKYSDPSTIKPRVKPPVLKN